MPDIAENRHIETRPWGSFERFVLNQKVTVKIVSVRPEQRISLQFHKNRSELWHLVSGNAVAVLDGKEIVMEVGDQLEVPVRAVHRLIGGKDGAVILEIAQGEFDEEDIVRLQDDYQRA